MFTEVDGYLNRIAEQVALKFKEEAVTILNEEGEFIAAYISSQDVNLFLWELQLFFDRAFRNVTNSPVDGVEIS